MSTLWETLKRHVVVTAEIGINHDGKLDQALALIDAAHEAGADAVKFQAFHPERLLSYRHPGFAHTGGDVFPTLKKLSIPPAWWSLLRSRVKEKNMFFGASIFDAESLSDIQSVGVDFVKVASAEITNIDFVISQKMLSSIFVVSTGMSFLDEISTLVTALHSAGIDQLILLECTTSYPADAENIFLKNIPFLQETFGIPSGYSDHSTGICHALGAVALGACFIEKHFTLDRHLPGPDHNLSAEPAEFQNMVHNIRLLEKSLQSNRKQSVCDREKEERLLGRKSLIARFDLPAGTIISAKNTEIKRPGLGIPPSHVSLVYGRALREAVMADQWIERKMVE